MSFYPEQKWNPEIRSPLNSYNMLANNTSPKGVSVPSNLSLTTLPPLLQVIYDSSQMPQGQQFFVPMTEQMIQQKPTIPEHDEKCPFRTDGQPRIPRPRNAFILFRQRHHQAVLDEGNVIKSNPDVSKELGKRWRALSGEEKEYWNKLAEEEKKKHLEKYPGYRYIPRRAGKRGNCAACKIKAAIKSGVNPTSAVALNTPPANYNNMMGALNGGMVNDQPFGDLGQFPPQEMLVNPQQQQQQQPRLIQQQQQQQFNQVPILYSRLAPPVQGQLQAPQMQVNQMQNLPPLAQQPPQHIQQQKYLPRSMLMDGTYEPNMAYDNYNQRFVSLPHINRLDLPSGVNDR